MSGSSSDSVKKPAAGSKKPTGKPTCKKKTAARRRPEYCGTAYTEGMSNAYWKGVTDGETTASRMIHKPAVRVRRRALAVISLGDETPLTPAVPEAEETAAAVYAPKNEQLAQAVPPEATAVAVLERDAEHTQLIEAQPRTGAQETAVMNINDNRINSAIVTPQQTAEVTYSLKKGEIISGAVGTGVSAAQTKASPAPQKNAARNSTPSGKSNSGKKFNKNAPNKSNKKGNGIVQPWSDISLPRKLIIVLSTVLFLFAFSPLLVGVTTIGILPIALIGLFFFAVSLFWDKIEGCENKFLNFVFSTVAVIVALGIVGMAFISGKMYSASLNTLPDDVTRTTVVVLGCRIKGDQPSLMLKNRLDTAADYLLSNPEAFCVVTGGQGEDEEYAEAVIMKRYLIEKGISSGRIIAEKKSTSTVENLVYSAKLIDKYNCHENIVIVSDRFHQYRAKLAAQDAGLKSYAMPCETRWELVAQYWFREMAGIAKIWLEGGSELPEV